MKQREAWRINLLGTACFVLLCLLWCLDSAADQSEGPKRTRKPALFWNSSSCRGCHYKIYKENAESMHERSFTNPVFQAQYFGKVVPDSDADPSLREDARGCSACHMPIAYLNNNEYVRSANQVDAETSGVACDFCHTMTGYKGDKPGNGNYVSSPGDKKYGPINSSNHHQEFSAFFAESEFCAVCHNAFNSKGVEVKATFTEWKGSRYPKDDIHCQDCHMNVNGRLTGGKAVFDSGSAAYTTLIDFKARNREELHTHRFPGAHHKAQMTSALALEIDARRHAADEITIDVLVDNSQTGHKMPTGSVELRLLWLDLKAHIGQTVMSLPATTRDGPANGLDVIGMSPFDRAVIGNDIPDGMRVYRTVFTDSAGNQTLYSYKAEKIIFDNRLGPSEKRHEIYSFKIPKGTYDNITITADLFYLRYPSSFAKSINAPAAEAVKLASATGAVRIKEE